jgi:DNA-binding transcriptional MerR regulator
MEQLNLFSRDKQPDMAPKGDHPDPKTSGASKKRGRKSLKTKVDIQGILEQTGKLSEEKQYYSISEVAEIFGVNASLIRFWENEFDILQPKKNRKGDRLFRPEDILNLRLIYHLLRVRKYTIEGARQKLKEDGAKTARNFELIQSLQKLRNFLVQLRETI